MLNKKFRPNYTTNQILSPKLQWNKYKQEEATPITPNNVLNSFIVYELDTWSQDLNTDFTLKGCLFGSVKVIKNDDTDKYSYSGYGVEFDSRSLFLGLIWAHLCILIIKEKNILILGKGPTQGLNGTTFTAEAEYSINFSRSQNFFCLSLHYCRSNSFLFANATKIYQFKAKDSEIKKYPTCLGNISKDFTANNMK